MPPHVVDFSRLPLADTALDPGPMRFMRTDGLRTLAGIMEICAVETGERGAREKWQRAQLRNLLQHAHRRSAFWRDRIGDPERAKLESLPVLSRADVIDQVKSEGSLVGPEDKLRVKKHASSGSSGFPVEFYVTEMNAGYGSARFLAQYFIEGRDLTLNRTRIKHLKFQDVKRLGLTSENGFTVEMAETWLGQLGQVFKGGGHKLVKYWHPERKTVLAELARHPLGYFGALPSYVESLFVNESLDFLKAHGAALFIPIGEGVHDALRARFAEAGIRISGGYSAEETGGIAHECPERPAVYHVMHSNVIVEADEKRAVACGGRRLTPLLVTCLHSYATPLIRYDLNDLGVVEHTCECGHDGVTLSHISGRAKALLSHADGRLTLFLLRPFDLMKIAPFHEHRVRQTAIDELVLEIAGGPALTAQQIDQYAELLRGHADDDFKVEVRRVEAIDWGGSHKRLGFRNELLADG